MCFLVSDNGITQIFSISLNPEQNVFFARFSTYFVLKFPICCLFNNLHHSSTDCILPERLAESISLTFDIHCSDYKYYQYNIIILTLLAVC